MSREILDLVDENGVPTGETISREEAHRTGARHRVVHVWLLRERDGRREVLLEQRSAQKDSFPLRFDTCAGHIDAGDEPAASALRELHEELGVIAAAEDLTPIGRFLIRYEREFHGALFRDHEISFSYVYARPVDEKNLRLQPEEVADARWFGLEALCAAVRNGDERFCVSPAGLKLLTDWLETQ